MLRPEEAKALNMEPLTQWLHPNQEMSTQWGLLSAQEWVTREAARLLEKNRVVECVEDPETRQVAIFMEFGPWR